METSGSTTRALVLSGLDDDEATISPKEGQEEEEEDAVEEGEEDDMMMMSLTLWKSLLQFLLLFFSNADVENWRAT